MIHVAMTIFHPHRKSQFEYLKALARVRLRNWLAQDDVSELTLLTCVRKDAGSFEEMILSQGWNRYDKADIYIARRALHPGAGYLQQLVKPATEWVYFDEDGHMLPIRKNSARGWLDDAVCQVGHDQFDVLVEGSQVIHEETSKPEHLRAFAQYMKGRRLAPTITTGEWGHYQRSATIGDYCRPPQPQRCQDGTFYLHQGARVAFSNTRGQWHVHHGLNVGPSSFALQSKADDRFGCASLPRPDNELAESLQQNTRDAISRLGPLEQVSYRNGKLVG